MPKKPVDANKPRGPITPYALFVRTCRDELRRKYPNVTVDYNIISKKCSERWKAMNDNEKKRFQDAVELERKRYKEKLANYEQEQLVKQQQQQQQQLDHQQQFPTSSILLSNPPEQTFLETVQQQQQKQQTIAILPKQAIRKRTKKPKDPHAPKKPLSAYFLFCADERPKVQGSQAGLSLSDIARELGIRWKQASAEVKTKYEQAAIEKKDAYKAEMAIYKQ